MMIGKLTCKREKFKGCRNDEMTEVAVTDSWWHWCINSVTHDSSTSPSSSTTLTLQLPLS